MRELAGKVAFITGGSSGIGLGIARAFVDAGLKVVIGYRTDEHLDEAMKALCSAGNRIRAIRVDVTDRADLEAAAVRILDVFGKVHVLVNNAGVVNSATLCETTYDDWDFVMGVNLNGVFNGLHVFLPRILSHGEGGHIVSTSSLLGLMVAGRGQAAYSVSKFAVVGMMEALRTELAGTDIGVSVFCPGLVTSNVMDSNRNRPRHLMSTGAKADEEMLAAEREARKNPMLAMDPFEAGRLVLRGIVNNDLYILTHSEFERVLRARNEALMASIPTDLPPTAARLAIATLILKSSVYVSERDRRLIAREASGGPLK